VYGIIRVLLCASYDVEIVKVYAKKRPGWEEGLQLVTNSLSGYADEVGGGS
jgi:hypothetical protein